MTNLEPMRINLSLVSHTNIGKTTLARTLLGRDIGEVADRPHVTETADDHVLIRGTDGCSELVLWDTPGFGDSIRLAQRLEGRSNPLGWFLSELWDRMSNKALWLNQRAIKHVKDTSSVVLYLVNASESPQASNYIGAEMQILSWINKPVIVLLNQMGKPREQAIEEAELKQWQDYMAQFPLVKDVLPMDAFARCWVQEFALMMLSALCSFLNHWRILFLASLVVTILSQSRLGPRDAEEVRISTISPVCGTRSMGTIIPLILAPTILLPTAEWMA